jgi:hypothetical protein
MAQVLRTDVHLSNPTTGLPEVLKRGTKRSDLEDWTTGKATDRNGKATDEPLLGDHVFCDEADLQAEEAAKVAGPGQTDTTGLNLIDDNPLSFGTDIERRGVGPDEEVEIEPKPARARRARSEDAGE